MPAITAQRFGRQRRWQRGHLLDQAHHRGGRSHHPRAGMQQRPRHLGQRRHQVEGLLEGVPRAGDDVGLAGLAALHRQDVPPRGVLDVGPAEGGAPRRERQPLAQQVHERGVHAAGVAGPVDDAGLDDHERQPPRHHRQRHLVVRQPLRAVVLAAGAGRRSGTARRASRPGCPRTPPRCWCTRPFGMPSSHIISSTWRVPSTLMRSASSPGTPTLYQAAQWYTPSAPAIGARRLSRSVMSPWCSSTPSVRRTAARAGSRTRADHLVAPAYQLLGQFAAQEPGGPGDEITAHARIRINGTGRGSAW